jgi:Ribosome associated membrane protein RAMP4
VHLSRVRHTCQHVLTDFRNSICEMQKAEKLGVGPILLGFFLFVVVGSGALSAPTPFVMICLCGDVHVQLNHMGTLP